MQQSLHSLCDYFVHFKVNISNIIYIHNNLLAKKELTTINSHVDIHDVIENAALSVIFKVEELFQEVTELVELTDIELPLSVGDKILKARNIAIKALTERK